MYVLVSASQTTLSQIRFIEHIISLSFFLHLGKNFGIYFVFCLLSTPQWKSFTHSTWNWHLIKRRGKKDTYYNFYCCCLQQVTPPFFLLFLFFHFFLSHIFCCIYLMPFKCSLFILLILLTLITCTLAHTQILLHFKWHF